MRILERVSGVLSNWCALMSLFPSVFVKYTSKPKRRSRFAFGQVWSYGSGATVMLIAPRGIYPNEDWMAITTNGWIAPWAMDDPEWKYISG